MDNAMLEQERENIMSELTTIEKPQAITNPIESTGDLMRDMAAVAVQRGDVAMLKELKAMIDGEDARRAERAYSAAYAKAQSEFPFVPQRGRGHNGISYARIEDIMQAIMPILSKHGLSLRHLSDNESGVVKVTAILSHVDGHSERCSMQSDPDKSGSKNAIQAIKSANTYLRRVTTENLLGLTSHGEDDDAFRSVMSASSIETMRTIEHAKTHEAMAVIKSKLMTDTTTNKDDVISLKKAWAAKNEVLHNQLGEA